MLTRWPQLQEQTSPVFRLDAHLETGHTEPPHLRISSRKKKTRHLLTYLLCISCLLLVLVLCCVTSAPVTSGQGSASVCLIDSDRSLGKWWRPRGHGSRSGPMDLGQHINWVHCSYYCSSLKTVIFFNMHIHPFPPTKLWVPIHLVLNRRFSPVFCSNHRNTRLKLPSLNWISIPWKDHSESMRRNGFVAKNQMCG